MRGRIQRRKDSFSESTTRRQVVNGCISVVRMLPWTGRDSYGGKGSVVSKCRGDGDHKFYDQVLPKLLHCVYAPQHPDFPYRTCDLVGCTFICGIAAHQSKHILAKDPAICRCEYRNAAETITQGTKKGGGGGGRGALRIQSEGPTLGGWEKDCSMPCV